MRNKSSSPTIPFVIDLEGDDLDDHHSLRVSALVGLLAYSENFGNFLPIIMSPTRRQSSKIIAVLALTVLEV